MQAPRPAASEPIVLVVAGEPAVVQDLRRLLERFAARLVVTATPEEALAVLATRPAAAVVIDVGAPTADAVAALAARYDAAPILAVAEPGTRMPDGVIVVDRDPLLRARIEALCVREALDARRRSETTQRGRVRPTGDHLPAPSCACDAGGRILWANARWRVGVGEAAAAWFDAVHPAERPAIAERWRTAVAAGGEFAAECPLRGDGGYRWHAVVACPRRAAPGAHATAWVVLAIDVHRRWLESEALNRGEREMRLLADALPALVAYVDADQRYRFVNRTYRRWFGRGGDAIVGRTLAEILGPAAYAAAGPWFAAVLRGEPIAFDAQLPAGDEIRDVAVQYVPDTDERGGVRGFAVLMTDITARKGAEREAGRARDALASKATHLASANRELEQFGYVVSHDLQEPLRMVRQFVTLARGRAEGRLDPKAMEFLDRAIDGAERMGSMLTSLLAYARAGRIQQAAAPVPLADALADARAVLAQAIADAGASVEAVGALPAVRADRSRLTQLLQNLIGNAIKFRRADDARVVVDAADGETAWTIAVRDNGIGIPADARERVFEPFQRLHTRDEYPGTGIGLAICHKIVNQHGGRIWVEDGIDGGAAIVFTLPKSAAGAS